MPLSLGEQKVFDIFGIALPIVFFIFLLIFVVMFIILNFHWKKYGANKRKARGFKFLYLFIGTFLILGMFINLLRFYS